MTGPLSGGRCSKMVDLLVDYLEGRLAPGVRADLKEHLGACERCVAQVRTYRSTVSLLRSLRDDDLPPELRDTVRIFLEQKSIH